VLEKIKAFARGSFGLTMDYRVRVLIIYSLWLMMAALSQVFVKIDDQTRELFRALSCLCLFGRIANCACFYAADRIYDDNSRANAAWCAIRAGSAARHRHAGVVVCLQIIAVAAFDAQHGNAAHDVVMPRAISV
jgi:hypothetical protein